MMVLGITGGIGAGKSKASRYVAEKGFAIVDADRIGHEMTADGQPMLEKLDHLFGPEGRYGEPGVSIVKKDTEKNDTRVLNRQVLADLVFHDAEKKAAFDALMHGEIISEIDRRIAGFRSENDERLRGVILDAPLLYEAGIDNRCDCVLLITADENVKIQRIMSRDGMSEKQIRDRMRNQMKDSEKEKKADFVIDNSGDYEELKKNLDAFIESFC